MCLNCKNTLFTAVLLFVTKAITMYVCYKAENKIKYKHNMEKRKPILLKLDAKIAFLIFIQVF